MPISPWLFVALPVALVAAWIGSSFLFAELSGWRDLARHYATELPPTGHRFSFCTANVSGVSMTFGLHFAVTGDGLMVWPIALMRRGARRLLIPWSELQATRTRRLWAWMGGCVDLTSTRVPGAPIAIEPSMAQCLWVASRMAFRFDSE